jgi:ferredoxin
LVVSGKGVRDRVEGESFGVHVMAARCTGCGECVEACPAGAI